MRKGGRKLMGRPFGRGRHLLERLSMSRMAAIFSLGRMMMALQERASRWCAAVARQVSKTLLAASIRPSRRYRRPGPGAASRSVCPHRHLKTAPFHLAWGERCASSELQPSKTAVRPWSRYSGNTYHHLQLHPDLTLLKAQSLTQSFASLQTLK